MRAAPRNRPVRPGGQAQPAQPEDQALDTSALHPAPITLTRSAHLRYAPLSSFRHTFRHARRERDMRMALHAPMALSATT